MSIMTLPVGWVKDNVDDNAVIYTRPNHTAKYPDLVLFKRVPRTVGGVTSKYQVKLVKGDDWSATGSGPTGPNTLVEINIRNTDAQVNLNVRSALGELGALLADPGFQADAVDTLSLPI